MNGSDFTYALIAGMIGGFCVTILVGLIALRYQAFLERFFDWMETRVFVWIDKHII